MWLEQSAGWGLISTLETESERLAGPIRQALWARGRSLGFLLSVTGSLWQV